MPTPQIPKVNDNASLEELRDCYIGMNRYLTYLLTALDTQNISRLDAKVIIAESITAGKLAADSVETGNLQAGAVTAEKITVDELSAISANLGHITAGLIESIRIFGSYIATRNGAFPRAELNNTGDLLAVYTDANNYLTIEPGITGEPTVTIRKSGAVSLILGPAFGLTGLLASTPIVLGTQNGNTNIVCGDSDDVIIPSWSQFKNTETGTSLQAELDSLRAEIAGKADISHSHSVSIPNHNHGNPDNATSGGGTFSVS
ncbi:hypothetical protein [Paenibacillus sp. FSL L8-0499]|uniref:hypothetical protein n=1 Tax=Paenibacillus sp. FSL L8-0499 TaxID=2975334 RepID=UPI0030FB771B